MGVPRGFHFFFVHEKSRFVRGFRRERQPKRIEPTDSFQFPERWKSKPRFYRESPDVHPLPLYTSIPLFSILFRDSVSRRARVHQRRSETGNRLDVSSATRRNFAEDEEKRNSLRNPPLCVYVFNGKRRKYCVATNKNMYRVLREKCTSP